MSTPADQLPFPYFDPSQANTSAWLNAQQKQRIAQMLMGAMQQTNQTPQDWNSMRVVPRRSPLQTVSTLVGALAAGKGMGAANTATQQYLQDLYGGGQSTQSPATGPGAGIVSPDASPDTQAAAQAVTDLPPGSGPAGAQTAGLLPQAPASQTQSPFLPPRMDPRTAMMLTSLPGGAAEYAKLMTAPYMPLDIQRRLSGAGVDPNSPQGQAVQRGALTKETAIEMRPGMSVKDPVSGLTMIAADPSKGEFYSVDPQSGEVVAHPITNDATIQAWRQSLSTAATQQNTPREIPMGGGRTRVGYLDETPPALRIPGTPQGAAPGAAPPGAVPPAGSSNGVGASPPSAAPTPSAAVPASGRAATAASAPGAPRWDSAWSNIPTIQAPVTPGMSSDTLTQGRLTNAVAKDKELSDKFGAESTDAQRRLLYNQNAMAALPNAEVGPMSEWLTRNRSGLMELGVPSSLIPADGSVTPTLELNKNLTNAALQNARQNFPRLTQAETFLQKEEMSPSATMTRDAIGALIRQDNVQAQYVQQRANDYQRFRSQGGDPTAFENWYTRNRPLSRFAAQSDTPPAALARVHSNPSFLPAFKQKYGWDPTQ